MRPAASTVLLRRRPDLELYLVRRARALRFFAGYHAFPGGAVERDDGAAPLHDAGRERSHEERVAVVAAARELVEETGLLASRPAPTPEQARNLRQRLVAEERAASFSDLLAESGMTVDGERFVPLARLVTPTFSAIRFDTRFFLVELGEQEEPGALSAELDADAWYRPRDAFAAWRRGEIYLTPPALAIVEALVDERVDLAAERLRPLETVYEGSGRAIPWLPGIDLLPLYTPPLPRTLPTNAFLVGESRFFIVDPGPSGAAEREHLVKAIAARAARGHRPIAVVLTHHHVDHIGAVEEVCRRFDLPVWAHPITATKIAIPVDRTLEDGDRLELGESPDGQAGWRLEALFTPGHAEGHLAFWDAHQGALLAGDLVSTSVSMYVGSPGGHLATYLRSLERIERLPVKVLLPSHGAPTLDLHGLLEHTRTHRAARTEQIAGLLGNEAHEVSAIAHAAYPDAAPGLREFVERSTRATLEFLVEAGRATRSGRDAFAAR